MRFSKPKGDYIYLDKPSLHRQVEADLSAHLQECGLTEPSPEFELGQRFDRFPDQGTGHRRNMVSYLPTARSENPRAICFRVQPSSGDTCRIVEIVFPAGSGEEFGLGVGSENNADIEAIRARLGEGESEEIPSEELVLNQLVEQAETIQLPAHLALLLWCVISFADRLIGYYQEAYKSIEVLIQGAESEARPLIDGKQEALREEKRITDNNDMSPALKLSIIPGIRKRILELQDVLEPLEEHQFNLEQRRLRMAGTVDLLERFRDFLKQELVTLRQHRSS